MALLFHLFLGIFQNQTVGAILLDLALLAAPLWLALFAGVFIGWLWRPKWAATAFALAEPGAADSVIATAACQSCNRHLDVLPTTTSSPKQVGKALAVTDEDLVHLCRLVEVKDGGPTWQKMMDKSSLTFTYQAWHRDPPSGPPQYRSSTVFEDATPESVRNFFWDDEFRISNGWDDMLLQHKTLEECSETGTMIVHWTRKFPFFCSDREYIIGRRIWNSGKTYYCVTKGAPYPSVPKANKPKRVGLYYSSWCIRPAPSKRDGQMTACEVLLFHHEDMGIPRGITKFGVSQGMWGCVRRIERGLRAYQAARRSNEPLSQCASMAQINTKVDAGQLSSLDISSVSSSEITEIEKPKHWSSNVPKILVIGGAVALACSVDHGLVTKAAIFGVARRLAGQAKNCHKFW